MVINRTKNTISGTFFGVVQKVISLVFPFVIRTIFIWTIGIQYLGLNSLFTSILQVLNLAELGVGAALVFSMYKPIVDNDEQKICSLMNLYRKYYRIIGAIVLAAGLILMPFIPYMIEGEIPSDINIYIIYAMNLASTVISYWLFAYRNSLFQAHQRLDVVSIVTIGVNLVQYSIQIALLFLFGNYYLFLSVNIFSQILLNVVIALFSKKYYPLYSPKGNLEREEIKTINRKMGDLFTAKLGGVITTSFDSIVISAFLGLTLLALYQNYFYVVTAICGIIMIFFSSIQAGIGNYLITKTKTESAVLLRNVNHITMFACNICCCCLITLYQPFMTVWLGEEYLLQNSMVIMFTAYFFAYVFIRPFLVFKDAAGMWKEDKFRPLVSSLVNLALNLATVKWLGLYGVLGSTIVSYLLVSFPWVLININKYMFKINVQGFLLKEFLYTLVIGASCTGCFFICRLINFGSNILNMAVYLLISLTLPSIVFFVFFIYSKENNYFMKTTKGFFGRIIRRFHSPDPTLKQGKKYLKKFSKYSFSGTKAKSCKGYEAIITRYYHTLEKGLAFPDYKPNMSSIGANLLIDAMKNYIKDGYSPETEFYETALSVLFSYYEKEKEYGFINSDLYKKISNLPGKQNSLGGLICFSKPKDTNTMNFESIMKQRHSVRFFDSEIIDDEILKKAIELAQFTPSACNRQGWRTIVVSDEQKIQKVLSNQNGNKGFGQGIHRLLVIVSDLRYFNSDREVYQAFIDGGMYAESVINSLFYYGLGSIPLSASLSSEQEKNVRNILGLEDAEILILFIGVGHFCEYNQTTRSERKKITVETI